MIALTTLDTLVSLGLLALATEVIARGVARTRDNWPLQAWIEFWAGAAVKTTRTHLAS